MKEITRLAKLNGTTEKQIFYNTIDEGMDILMDARGDVCKDYIWDTYGHMYYIWDTDDDEYLFDMCCEALELEDNLHYWQELYNIYMEYDEED